MIRTSRIAVPIVPEGATARCRSSFFLGGGRGTGALVDGKLKSYVTAVVRPVGRAH